MKPTHLLLALLLVPLASAVTITAPTSDITAQTLPTSVTAQWDGTANQSYTATLHQDGTLADNTTTNQTSKTYTLDTGNYTLTVTQQNSSDTTQFAVTKNTTNETDETEPPQLSISADSDTYDIGDTVYLTASSDKTVTAQLTIEHDGQTLETYQLSIDGQVNLIYIPEQAGSFTARLTADGAETTETWTVNEVEPLTVDFTHTDAVVNEKTYFNATASGGEPPYSYQWLFSDDTASTGQNVVHYFFQTGTYTATLIVTDSDGTQQSTEKTLTVKQATHKLEVTVRDNNDNLLENIDVTLTDNASDDTTKTTGTSGTVSFQLAPDNYTLTLTQLDTTYLTRTVEMNQNKNLLFTLDFNNEQNETNATTNQATNTTNTTNTTNATTNQTTNTTNTTQDEQSTVQTNNAAQQQTAQPTPEELAARALEEYKEKKQSALKERKFDLKLSSQKDTVLTQLGLYDRFDEAQSRIPEAQSEQAVDTLLKDVPTDVKINSQDQKLTYPDPEEIKSYVDQYLEAKNVLDEDLKEQYQYTAKQAAKNASVKTTTTHATITYQDRKERHTIVTKEVTAPKDSHVIEIIPKAFAKDVSKLRIDGDYQVLESDPVLQFTSHTYTYSAAKNTDEKGYALIMPQQLQEPGMLSGLLAFRFGASSVTRSIIYIVLLGAVLAGIAVGSKLNKQRASTELFDEFSGLAEEALDRIQAGNGEQAAQITPDIIAIYEELPEDQQAALSDVIEHLEHNAQQQRFLGTLKTVYQTVKANPQDINTVSGAYEEALSEYEQLDNDVQEQVRAHLEQLDSYLDTLIQA